MFFGKADQTLFLLPVFETPVLSMTLDGGFFYCPLLYLQMSCFSRLGFLCGYRPKLLAEAV